MRISRKAFNILARQANDGSQPRSQFNFGRAVGDGLGSAVIVAPAMWVSRQFPEAPIGVRDSSGEIRFDHPLAELMRKPNPWYGGGTMRQALGFDYSIRGNVYLEKDRGTGRAVIGLVYIPSIQITPKGTSSELVTHYDQETSNGIRSIPAEDMIQFRNGIDPQNGKLGISALTSLLREIYTDDEAANMTAAVVRNMGIPGIVISPADADVEEIGPTLRETLVRYFKRSFSGDNAGTPLVLKSGAVKIDTLDIDFAKMNLDKLRQIPEERVTAVMGIPAAVVGFGSGLEQTKVGATMKELRELAYENVIIPMQRVFSDELDRSLLLEFEGNPDAFTVVFDNSDVRVLQEDENRKSDRVTRQWQAGLITRTESRVELGHDATPADEVYRQGFSDILVPVTHVASDPVEEEKSAAWIMKALKATPAERQAQLFRAFLEDARKLAALWADELQKEFAELGRQMAALWIAEAPVLAGRNGNQKAELPEADRVIIDRIMVGLVPGGNDDAFGYGAHYLRVLRATHESIERTIGLGVMLDDPIERGIVASGGTRRGLVDFTEQTRQSMYRTVSGARFDGLGADAIAERIVDEIPAGPWRSAQTRADIIARTETKFAQNESSLRVYNQAENVSRVLAFDAQLGETDADCEARNGQPFSLTEAQSIVEHPNGTLSWAPIVDDPTPVPTEA